MKKHTPLTALYFAMLCTGATAQTITNGSFEYNSQGSAHTWASTAPAGDITQAGGQADGYAYLTGWDVYRPESWSSSWADPQFVTVYQDGSNPWSGYIDSTPTGGGVNTGLKPVNAIDGSSYLTFYHDFAPADLLTHTSAHTTITGLQAGQSYQLSYWYAGVGESNGGYYHVGFDTSLGGSIVDSQTILDFTDAPAASGPGTGVWMTDNGAWNGAVYTNWAQATVNFTATGSSMDLSFNSYLQGGPAELMLDSVSIAAVPEPSSAILAYAALFGLALRRPRRSRTSRPATSV